MATLRFAGYQPERSVHTRAAHALAEALAESSAGRMSLEVIPQITTTGRAAADILTMTEHGEFDLCYFASSYLVHRVPELGVLDLPFEGAGRSEIWRRLGGDAGRLLAAAVAKHTGYELVAFWDNGVRHISNRVRPVRSYDDCQGLSLRTLDNAFHKEVFAALGFMPRFIDVKDLAREVHGQTIDAQENPLTNLMNFELHKTHRYVSLTGHFFGIALVLANRVALEKLSALDRTSLSDALAIATEVQRRLAAAEDADCLAALESEGVQIVGANEIEFASFRARLSAVVAEETARLEPALLAAWRQ